MMREETDEWKARAEAAEKEAEMYRREAAHARTLASGWAEANAERSRAVAAERERDEAQEALQNLAADHYFARAEAAEDRISILERQVQNLGALATERQARCATLEAALRQIAEAEEDVQWNIWMIETAEAALAAAATSPPEEATS